MSKLHTSLQHWQSKGQYFDYRSHRIFYVQEGNGPDLLLVHGFPTASWDWHKVWPSLKRHYRLLAMDMLGFGFSDKPYPYPYSIMDQADLVEMLIKKLKITQCQLLAHDYGDTVAQELMARQLKGELSFNIQSVCFLNGGLFPGVHRPRLIQKILASPVGTLLPPFLGKQNLRHTFQKIFGKNSQPTAAEIDAFWHLVSFKNGKKVIPLVIRYMQERSKHERRWVGALEQFEQPMLLINGIADPISGQHLVQHFRQIVPSADVIELKGIGHYPQTEAAHLVANHYLAFIKHHFA